MDDHSSSLLNDGIRKEDAPTVYDAVENLIRLLRWIKELNPDSLDGAWLYKLDVSSAFKLLPMHPLWQIRQGIEVARADGSTTRHLQRQGAFGCRAMPHLWTTFMGLVLWLQQSRLGIGHPLAYMDDAYGIDRTRELSQVEIGGVPRLVPAEMAAISRLWAELGIPHESKKAEFGRELVITGFLVRLDQWDISISDDSKRALLACLADFLDPRVPRKQPTVRWQRALGYMNWGLSVMPFARPLLTPLYAKLRAPDGRPRYSATTLLAINQEVRRSVADFGAHLSCKSFLALDDPGLTEWTTANADLVVYTDACLAAEPPYTSSSGLGFWFYLGGVRHHFWSRPAARYAKIQFAETYCVVAAVLEALAAADRAGARIARLLVRTDSAAAVFAFDTAASEDTALLPLHSLLTRLYPHLRDRSLPVDLLVRHISGARNDLADKLSRLSPAYLARQYSSLHQFSPPDSWLGGRPVCQP